ncbi:MAG TPA: flagellar hook-basal body complex protein, partial [Verrucomicrobiae bacterium]|nr:flagellar hook-basal body complex protein [Verrucomicrobiae bacterium]
MQQFQKSLDVIGNNIANVETTGFKSARVEFADAFSQTLGYSGTSPLQVGGGSATASISNDYTQGSIASTGLGTDLAISGDGYFMVHDATSNTDYVTRDGEFRLDNTGFLINSSGMRVQGFSDAALATKGDIQIDGSGRPAT